MSRCPSWWRRATASPPCTPSTASAFALSCTEAGADRLADGGHGLLPTSTATQRRIGYLDDTTTAVYWGLRSPDSGATYAYNVRTDGTLSTAAVYVSPGFAARPAFNLKSSIVVSDSPDGDGCYTIESVPGKTGGLYVKNNGVWVQAA